MTAPSDRFPTIFTLSESPAELRCTHCGYSLQGLSADKDCPECGTPVRRSLLGNSLAASDPVWLEKLRRGASLKLLNVLIALLLAVTAALLMRAGVPQAFIALLGLVGTALGLWAVLLITTQEPRISLTEDPLALRQVVRTCAILVAVGSLLTQSQSLVATPILRGTGASVVFSVVVTLLNMTLYLGELTYFRRFALRIPDDHLAGSTRTVMWGFIVCTGLVTISSVSIMLKARAWVGPAAVPMMPGGSAFNLMMGFTCAGGLGLLVFGIWYIRLLFQYRTAFTEALAESREFATREEGALPAVTPIDR